MTCLLTVLTHRSRCFLKIKMTLVYGEKKKKKKKKITQKHVHEFQTLSRYFIIVIIIKTAFYIKLKCVQNKKVIYIIKTM